MTNAILDGEGRFDYTHNAEAFAWFYQLQGEFAERLAERPEVVTRWLDGRRVPTRCATQENSDSAGWRTARLSGRRHRELRALLGAGEVRPLAAWLLASLPLCLLFEIADADPAQGAADASARLVAMREKLFLANLGLAKAAAVPGPPEGYDDRLSAASTGLLDAIDRYVPGEGSARFGFFATYWIRYHLSRLVQKHGSVVAFPIHQQRLQRREGRPQFQRPQVVSLHSGFEQEGGEESRGWELVLEDPAENPAEACDRRDIAARLRQWLQRSVPPATRVMLAFAYAIGPLPEAADDYLAHLREIGRERLRAVAEE